MAVYDIRNSVNRIKRESLKSIGESPFEKVYRKADRMLYDFVARDPRQSGKKDCDNDRDEQIVNVISFLAKRGRGKTSVMLSYYDFIQNPDKLQEAAWSKFSKIPKRDTDFAFLEIPCIDAAMLSKNEFITEVILAEMSDKFQKLRDKNINQYMGSDEEDSDRELLKKKLKNQFLDVCRHHQALQRQQQGNKKDVMEDIPVATALHELAASMNLKTEIGELVRSYLKVFRAEKGYLVIAIDDIDMADGCAHEMLEQLRRFWSIPEVIILLTTDYERLKSVCTMAYTKQGFDSEEAGQFVNDYLAKVMPANRRIYLPELVDQRESIEITLPDEIKELGITSKSEKEIIIELFAKKCGIYFDGRRQERHFLQNQSLRGMVNYFNRFQYLGDGSQTDDYEEWLYLDLEERMLDRIQDEEHLRLAKRLLESRVADIGFTFMDFFDVQVELPVTTSTVGMGLVLYYCSELEANDLRYTPLINYIILLYSYLMKKADEEERKSLVGSGIWGEWDLLISRGQEFLKGEWIESFEERAELKFEITVEIANCLREGDANGAMSFFWEQETDEIRTWLYALMFVAVAIPSNGRISYSVTVEDAEGKPIRPLEQKRMAVREKVSDSYMVRINERGEVVNEPLQKLYIHLQPMVKASKSYFGFMIRGGEEKEAELKILIRDMIKGLYSEICELADVKASAELQREWTKKTESFVTGLEINRGIPSSELLQSPEILYGIEKKIEQERMKVVSGTMDFYDCMVGYCNIIEKALREQDEFYDRFFDGVDDRKPCFSENFRKQIYVRLFMDPDFLDGDVKDRFREKLDRLSRSPKELELEQK